MIYRATEIGFKGEDFHEKCDNKGATLIFIKVETDKGVRKILGGFTDISWTSENGFKEG